MKHKGIWFACGCLLVGAALCTGAYLEKGESILDLASVQIGDHSSFAYVNEHHEYKIEGVFDTYEIDCAAADIEIVKGDQLSIETWGIPEMDKEGTKSEWFSSKQEGTTYRNTYEMNHSLINETGQGRRILITLPDPIKNVTIHNALGNVDVSNLDLETLSIEDNLGDVNVWNHTSQRADLSLNMGDLEWSGSILERLDAHLDLGEADITLPGTENNYRFDLASTMGDVHVEETYGVDKTIKTRAKVHVATEMGDIDVSFD